jgi:two-component system, OmpR family, response regulator VanR
MTFFKEKNILLLENVDEVNDKVDSLFENFVKKIFVAYDVKEAINIFSNKKIDLIVSQTHLKNESGIDFIEIIRKNNDEIPIIVFSRYCDTRQLSSLITLNINGYLIKPIEFDVVEKILKTYEKKASIVYLKNGLKYNQEDKVIIKNEEIIQLNKKEVLFFEMIIANEGIISKKMFEKYIYEEKEITQSTLSNFILRLRKKFGKNVLFTIKNGYRVLDNTKKDMIFRK